jgi:type I restriction enzyme S subunit
MKNVNTTSITPLSHSSRQTYNDNKKIAAESIPVDWEHCQIGDVIKFSGGSQPPLSTFIFEEKEGYIRLIQTRDYRTDKFKTYIRIEDANKTCNKEDIIIGRYGPPVFQIFKGLEGAYNVALMKAIPNEKKINKTYCYYFLSQKNLQNYLEGLSQRSGGQTGVEIDLLNKYSLALPPIEEQKKIAEVLSTWDEAINLTRKNIKKITKRNQGLAQQLLTGKKRLSGFSYKWEMKKVKDFSKEISSKNKEDEDLIVLSCTKYNGLVPSLEYFGRKIYSDNLKTYKIVEKNVFAYATNHIEEGSIGYQSKYEKALISPMYTVFKTDENINDEFLFRILKSNTYIQEYQKRMEGSIDRRGGLRWQEFSKIKVSIPTFKEQTAIAQVLETANKELKSYQTKLETLQLQKKGLMQQLLTGKIRVNVN